MRNRIKQLKNHKEQIDEEINLFQVDQDEDVLEKLHTASNSLQSAIHALEDILNK